MNENEESRKPSSPSLSIRLDNEDGKNEWVSLQARTNLTSKDLLLDVIRLKKDQLEAESGGISELITPQMIKVKEHTERIIQSFAEITRSEADQKKFHMETVQTLTNDFKTTLDSLRERIDIAENSKKDSDKAKKEAEENADKLSKRNIELEAGHNNSNYLIETLRLENDEMRKRIGFVDELEFSISELEDSNKYLQLQLKESENRSVFLEGQLVEFKQERIKEISELRESYALELRVLRQEMKDECDNMINEMKRENERLVVKEKIWLPVSVR